MEKALKKHGSKIALILLIILLVTSIGIFAVKSNNITLGNTAAAEAAAVATSADESEDYSVYTDNPLPNSEEEIKSNITRYVPISLFGKVGTTVYYGKNYGFIFHYGLNTSNMVLLFTIDYQLHADGFGYDNIVKVVHEGSYDYAGYPVSTPSYHLAIGNLDFDSNIINANSRYNNWKDGYVAEEDMGAFYIQSRYSGVFTYRTGSLDEALADKCISLLIKSIPVVGSHMSKVYDALKMKNAYNNVYQTNSSLDTAIDFPVTKQAQIESDITGHKLVQSLNISMLDECEEFLAYNAGKESNYAKATYRMNEINAEYYIQSALNFSAYTYHNISGANAIGDFSVDSIYNMRESENQYSELYKENEEKFALKDYSKFAPLVKGTSFEFTPDKSGYYGIFAPSGYTTHIKQKDGYVAIASEKGTYLIKGKKYVVAFSKDGEAVDWNYKKSNMRVRSDFIGNQMNFADITIKLNQDLELNNNLNINGGVYYKLLYNEYDNNDLYKLVCDDISDMQLYITDTDYNIISTGAKIDGAIYCNFPMKTGKTYYLICENVGESRLINITNEGVLELSDYITEQSSDGMLYYAVTLPYKQWYKINGAYKGLYVAGGDALYGNIADGYYIDSMGTYYLLTDSPAAIDVSVGDIGTSAIVALNKSYRADNTLNHIFTFAPAYTLMCSMGDDTLYDVYRDGVKVGDNVNKALLEAGHRYAFIKLDNGTSFELVPDSSDISVDEKVATLDAPAYSVYRLTLDEPLRIEINTNYDLEYVIYDADMRVVSPRPDLTHGYPLDAGVYSIVVANSGNYDFTVTEKLIPIAIEFIVDGEAYVDESGTVYYYGKHCTLPVPHKDRFDFNGWMSGGVMITDGDGNTVNPLEYDSIRLEATWTARAVIMKIDMGGGVAKWWTGEEIVDSAPSATVVEGDMIEQLINLKSSFIASAEGKKVGHYLKTFEIVKTGADSGTDYFSFLPIWERERYFVRFNADFAAQVVSDKVVSYGDVIDSNTFPAAIYSISVRGYRFDGWRVSIGRNDYIAVDLSVGGYVPDLTPGYGSEFNYTFDVETDCTQVDLKGELTALEYTITINGEIKARITCEQSYTIGTLESYYSDTSRFAGYNVAFEDKANNRYYYSGKTIDEIYDNIVLTLDMRPIKFTIDYGGVETTNVKKYDVTIGDIVLSSVSTRGYEYKGWLCNNVNITVLNKVTLNITQYYSVDEDIITDTIYLKANFVRGEMRASSYTGQSVVDPTGYSNVVYVDCTGTGRGATLSISSNIKEVTFAGSGSQWTDTCISVGARADKLVINFDNINFSAKSKQSVISAAGCYSLELYSYNSTKLYAGEASNYNAQHAIVCRNISFLGESFSIKGGDEPSLANLATPSMALYNANGNDVLTAECKSITLTGGNGKSGYGGASGKDGVDTGESGTNGSNGGRGSDGNY
ncbi:MAG: hypothetical protein K2M44_03515, partial [Clostridia bacterium]|nr:hypothetical protein [Clostridia bacterium]